MSAPDAALNGLRRERPEWEPWLVVVDEILREAGSPAWEAAVPAADPRHKGPRFRSSQELRSPWRLV